MEISSDYIAPVELTGYVRAALANMQANQFTLNQWLPNQPIDDLHYRFTTGGEGLVDAAPFRAYDAESPIGTRPGVSRVTGELPPISRKIRLGEYDRLRQRRLDAAVRDAILDDAERMTRAVAARVELARGEALTTGQLAISENGVTATVDFGRDPSHTVAPATLWSNTATATPVTDLMAWRDVYVATNGEEPGAILTSRRVIALMMRNDEVKNVSYPAANQPSTVTEENVRAILTAYGLPPIYPYEAQVRVNGVAQRVVSDDLLVLLPAPGGTTQLGATLFGTTAESLEPEFGLTGEEPGIVAGSYSTKDPVALWTKAAAIALPVLANPDLTLTADVA